MSWFRQAPGAKSVKILTPLVVSSFRGRLIRQNMSKYVIFCFWRYRKHDRFVICHFSSFSRLLSWLFGNGLYIQVAHDLRKTLSGGQIFGAHCRDQVIIPAFQILPIPLTIECLHEKANVNYLFLEFPMHD